MRLPKQLFQLLSLRLLAVLVLLLVLFFLGQWKGRRMEDLQVFLFPFFILAFWRLPKHPALRLPLPCILFAIALFLGSRAYVEGWIPGSFPAAGPGIARLQGDGLEARELHRRFNEIARTYELAPAGLLPRNFEKREDAKRWLKAQEGAPFAVRGAVAWFEVVFAESQRRYLEPAFPGLFDADMPKGNPSLAAFGLGGQEQVVLVRPPGTPFALAVTYLPEAQIVPNEPTELSRHWLAWHSQGLTGSWRGQGFEQEDVGKLPGAFLAVRKNGLLEAASISGAWKTHAPLGLSEYLVGTLELLEAVYSDAGTERINQALEHFRKAAGLLSRAGSPQTTAAIFNNAAVAQVLVGEHEADLLRARGWFERALGSEQNNGISLGARAALYNLTTLELHALLPEEKTD